MPVFFKESIASFKNNNGREKKSFEVIKGRNGEIRQIRGVSNNNDPSIFLIEEKIKRINDHGIIHSNQRAFKLKSNDIIKLLKEKPKENTKKNLIKKPSVKKDLIKKPSVKKDLIKKPSIKKELIKKPTVKKELKKKPVVKKDLKKKPVVKKSTKIEMK